MEANKDTSTMEEVLDAFKQLHHERSDNSPFSESLMLWPISPKVMQEPYLSLPPPPVPAIQFPSPKKDETGEKTEEKTFGQENLAVAEQPKRKLYVPEEGLEPLLKIPGQALTYMNQDQQRTYMARLEEEIAKQKLYQALNSLSQKSGMPVTQENGQRRFGPPAYYMGPPPPKGSEVFVGRLPRDAFEPEILPHFERIGPIYQVRIMLDFNGSNRGYAFVRFFNPEDAANAILYMNQSEIRPGHRIGVVQSKDNSRLYIGGIPTNKTQKEIFDEMNRIADGVAHVIVHSDCNDRSKNRGFAFIEFTTHKAAAMARRKMLPGAILMWGVKVSADWAHPEHEHPKYYRNLEDGQNGQGNGPNVRAIDG